MFKSVITDYSSEKPGIPAAQKNENLRLITSFTSIPFFPEMGNGGFAIRAIELHRLVKMLPLLERFYNLTGYTPDEYDVPYVNYVSNELEHLTARAMEICNAHKQNISTIKSNITSFNTIIQTGSYSKDEVLDSVRKKESAEYQLETAERKALNADGIFSLLRVVIEHAQKNNMSEVPLPALAHIPVSVLPQTAYRQSSMHDTSLPSCVYAWSKMDKLEEALKNIIKSCIPPTDKYEIGHGGIELAELHKFYFSVEGESTRRHMTFAELSAAMTESIKEQNKHRSLIRGDL